MNDREEAALTARMEGQAVIVAIIGDPVEVSQMELICLCNFAEIGLMHLFAQLDGEERRDAKRSLQRTIAAIRRHFASNGRNGIERLSQSTAAMLRSEKFQKYIAG